MGLWNKKKDIIEKVVEKKDDIPLEEKKKLVEQEVQKERLNHKDYIATNNDIIQKAIDNGEDVENAINSIRPEQQKNDNKPIDNNLLEQMSWKLKLFEKSVLLLCIGSIMALIVWAFRVTASTPSQQVKNMVVWMVVMGMLILVVLLLNIGTGTGMEIWKRFFYKFKYRNGKYVNGIIAFKSGVWKEFFIKKEDTDEIRINKKPYVPNPKLLFTYKGMQSYFYREGNPDPMNIWETKLALKFSCAEVDNVMYSASTFDFKAWLQKNLMIFLIGTAATVLFALAATITGFMVYNMLKKGQYDPSPMINGCKEIFGIIGNQTIASVQTVSGGSIPIPTPTGIR